MTEEIGKYEVSGTGITKAQLLISPSLLLYEDPNYRPPTPEEITKAIAMTGLSSAGVANMLGVDSRNIRRYKSGQIHVMPYATWRLLLLNLGIVGDTQSKWIGGKVAE